MASSSQIASESPPSSDLCLKYDVFLSFRGPDTRQGITVDIYDRLNKRGIKTFMDTQGLQVGDVITPTLLAAIKGSRFAIVVLSQNYASSTWCLEELREICLTMEENRILPLFYHVDPTDVRYQKGNFEAAFSKHETSGRHESDKVKQWRAALNKVANISGWNTNDHKTHKELVNIIVEDLLSKVVPEPIETTYDFQAFEATKQAMDEIMKALKEDEVTAVGVYGIGGVGKTTLVEHVGAEVLNSGLFDYVTKGVVSQNPSFEKLQDALAEQLGFELHEKTETGRAARLKKEITRREKILIILDDIWKRMELSKIGIPSYKELQKCNSKLILTTRISNVCHAMDCQVKITLNILSKEDAWALFVIKARRSFESPTFESVAKKIAGECGCLPIALVTVARALGDKESLVEWKRAAQRLEKSQTSNPDDNGEVFKCIQLSYEYLKNEDYKSYFLLCCLFPEDYDIPIENMFKYAIGKGLFRDIETLEETRDEADSMATHLKHCCLLLESKRVGCVRMHDVVRDVALQIAQSKEGPGFFVKAGGLANWPRQLHEGYSAISLTYNDIRKLPEMLVCPKLQILLLNDNIYLEQIPETFFQGPCELTVLDISNTKVSLLPESFSLLINLQALFLDKCHIIDTSMLGKLKKLEILSMRYSVLKELSIEIGSLTSLRMLDNTGGDIVRIPCKVISKLHNLEELYMKGFVEWGCIVEGEGGEETNAGFDEVTSLSKLRVLKVSVPDAECIPIYVGFNPKWVEFEIRIGRYDSITCYGSMRRYENYDFMLPKSEFDPYAHNSIWLKVDVLSSLPYWFRDMIMKMAETLWWGNGRSLIDIFVESEQGKLQKLKHLFIVGPMRIKQRNTVTWVPRHPVFENLEELHLYLLDWADFCAVEFLPPGSLLHLKKLKLEQLNCYNMGNEVLPSTLLQRLINLEELVCRLLDGSKYLLGYAALLVLKQLNLRKIDLINLDTVRGICDGPPPPAMFWNLQSLSIQHCNQLQGSLFTYDVARCLSQLNCLVLHNCPLLERIVEASNNKIILPKLKKLSLRKLPMLCYESATFDIKCPLLEELFIEGCNQLQGSLFTYDVAQCLSQLNHFELGECPLLERIVEASNNNIILPKLKKLSLTILPMLDYESATSDLECPSLEDLRVVDCPQFSASSSFFHSRKQVRLSRSWQW